MTNNQTRRNGTLDVMKGIGMIAVILAHSKVPYLCHNILYSFHMPLFFVVGGYLYKRQIVNAQWIRHNLKRLVATYLAFCVSIVVIDLFKNHNGGGISWLHNDLISFMWANSAPHGETVVFGSISQGVGVAWFFFALFWCRLLFSLLENKLSNVRLPIVVFLISFFSVIGIGKILLPFAFWQGTMAVIFYYFGYLIRQCVNTGQTLSSVKNNVVFVLGILFTILIWVRNITHSHLLLAFGYFGCWETDVIGSLGGILLTYLLSALIIKCSKYIKRVLMFIGEQSLLILLLHCIEFKYAIFGNYTRSSALLGDVNYFMALLRCIIDIGIVYAYIKMKFLLIKAKTV